MMKSMRATVQKCELFSGGQGEEVFTQLLDQEVAGNPTRSGAQTTLLLQGGQEFVAQEGVGAGRKGVPGAGIDLRETLNTPDLMFAELDSAG